MPGWGGFSFREPPQEWLYVHVKRTQYTPRFISVRIGVLDLRCGENLHHFPTHVFTVSSFITLLLLEFRRDGTFLKVLVKVALLAVDSQFISNTSEGR